MEHQEIPWTHEDFEKGMGFLELLWLRWQLKNDNCDFDPNNTHLIVLFTFFHFDQS